MDKKETEKLILDITEKDWSEYIRKAQDLRRDFEFLSELVTRFGNSCFKFEVSPMIGRSTYDFFFRRTADSWRHCMYDDGDTLYYCIGLFYALVKTYSNCECGSADWIARIRKLDEAVVYYFSVESFSYLDSFIGSHYLQDAIEKALAADSPAGRRVEG